MTSHGTVVGVACSNNWWYMNIMAGIEGKGCRKNLNFNVGILGHIDSGKTSLGISIIMR